MKIKIFFVLFLAVLPFVSKAQFLGFAYKPFVAAENTPPGWTPSGTSANQGLFGLNVSTYETWRWNGSSWVKKNWDNSITSLGGQTGATQTFSTGTTGNNFNIVSSGNVHTFNLPTASLTARGVVDTNFQAFRGIKYFNSQIWTDNGSASLPVFRNISNGGVGLYFPNLGSELGIATNSLERVRILSNGRVGINTSPSARLHVNGQVRIDSLGTVTPTAILGDLNGVLGRITVGSGLSFTGGTLSATGGGGTPAGSNTQLQFNNSGAFGANYAFRANVSDSSLTVAGIKIWRGNGQGVTDIAIGNGALQSTTSGYDNTAIGLNALFSNNSGHGNTAYGYNSLYLNTGGYNNSATGATSLANNTNGHSNTANGKAALTFNTTGNNNTANGNIAGSYIADGITSNTITNNSVFLGANTKALANNQTNQIVIGYDATGLGSNTALLGNTSINKVGLGNIVLKTSPALGSGDDGKVLTYVHSAGEFQALTPTGGSGTPAGSNTQIQYNNSGAFGASSLFTYNPADTSLTVGNVKFWRGRYSGTLRNISIGANAYGTNNTGVSGNNIAIGDSTLFNTTTGINNNAIGYVAMRFNTTGSNNNANGFKVLNANTTGSGNTAMGNRTLEANTTGSNNVAMGFQTMLLNQQGSANTAIGVQALYRYNGTGNGNNTAIGSTAGSNVTGNNVTAIGSGAVNGAGGGSSGDGNIGVGLNSLYLVSTGNNNTVVGRAGLYSLTDGHGNVAIGNQAGRYTWDDGADIGNLSPDSSIYIGSFSKALNTTNNQNEIVIGSNVIGLGSNTASIGQPWATNTVRLGGMTINTTKPVNGDNGKVLTYNSGTGKMELATAASGGITSLGVAGSPQTNSAQVLEVNTTGNNLVWASSNGTHTLSIPIASNSRAVGLVTNGQQTFGGNKIFNDSIAVGRAFYPGTIILNDNGGTNAVKIKAPTSVTPYSLTLPTTAGSNGQVLTTNGSGVTSWTTVSGGSGETNTASNVGSGAGQVYKEKVGVDLRLRTIAAGAGITVTNNTNDITIESTAVQPPGTESISSSSSTQATAGQILQIDCTGGTRTVVPPTSPAINTRFAVSDARANAHNNNITIDFVTANQKLYGSVQNYTLNAKGGYVEFIWMGSSTGWIATK
jgi:hypothetical protein